MEVYHRPELLEAMQQSCFTAVRHESLLTELFRRQWKELRKDFIFRSPLMPFPLSSIASLRLVFLLVELCLQKRNEELWKHGMLTCWRHSPAVVLHMAQATRASPFEGFSLSVVPVALGMPWASEEAILDAF